MSGLFLQNKLGVYICYNFLRYDYEVLIHLSNMGIGFSFGFYILFALDLNNFKAEIR